MLHVVATDPQPEQTGVPINHALRIRVDRLLRPDSAVRQSVRITGGTLNAAGQSVAGDVFVEPVYDPVERVVTYRLQKGKTWQPTTRYTVTLWRASANPRTRDIGFRAFDGAELARSVAFGFETGDENESGGGEVGASYCSRCEGSKLIVGAQQILATSCGGASCHAGPGSAMGSWLTSVEGLRTTALAKPAIETLTGPSSVNAPANPVLIGRPMAIIEPKSPGNSYLIYKLLAWPGDWNAAPGQVASPLADTLGGSPFLSPAELERLRAAFLLGDPMPTGAAIGLDAMRTLSAWIADGAPTPATDDCEVIRACPQ